MKYDFPKQKHGGHYCPCPDGLDDAFWGPAIANCYEDIDGRLWVENGEYGSQVIYCPYCGTKAKSLLGGADDET